MNDLRKELSAIAKKVKDSAAYRKRQAELLAQREMDNEVADIIAKLQTICTREAQKGFTKAEIMTLEWGKHYKERHNTDTPVIITGGVVHRVCVFIETIGLTPIIEYWHDGCGMYDGFKLYASWN